jgi:hypothetical protein
MNGLVDIEALSKPDGTLKFRKRFPTWNDTKYITICRITNDGMYCFTNIRVRNYYVFNEICQVDGIDDGI